MVRIKYNTAHPEELHIDELGNTGGRDRKVGVLRRKTEGKMYESPKIVLDSYFKDIMGKRFKTFRGRAQYVQNYPDLRAAPSPYGLRAPEIA